jgi:hypothetical protein
MRQRGSPKKSSPAENCTNTESLRHELASARERIESV